MFPDIKGKTTSGFPPLWDLRGLGKAMEWGKTVAFDLKGTFLSKLELFPEAIDVRKPIFNSVT